MDIGGTVGRVRVRSQRVRRPDVLQPVAALMPWCCRKSGMYADTDVNSGRLGTLKSTSKKSVEWILKSTSKKPVEGIVSRGIVEISRNVDMEMRQEVNSSSVKTVGSQLCGNVLPAAR